MTCIDKKIKLYINKIVNSIDLKLEKEYIENSHLLENIIEKESDLIIEDFLIYYSKRKMYFVIQMCIDGFELNKTRFEFSDPNYIHEEIVEWIYNYKNK